MQSNVAQKQKYCRVLIEIINAVSSRLDAIFVWRSREMGYAIRKQKLKNGMKRWIDEKES